MNQRALVLAGLLFFVIIAAMFGYAYFKKTELATPVDVFIEEEVKENPSVTVNGIHFIKDGEHTIVAEVLMPTPCDLIQSDAVVRESMPEQVTIALRTINNTETCARVVTPQRFKVTFAASPNAKLSGTLDGKPVILNLRPADPSENPEEIEEFFLKG